MRASTAPAGLAPIAFNSYIHTMNEHVRHPTPRPTTQAAEGLPRWRWTTAELIRLTELGAFTPGDQFELIGGEIVPMSPEGRCHRLVADELAQMWGAIRLDTLDL